MITLLLPGVIAEPDSDLGIRRPAVTIRNRPSVLQGPSRLHLGFHGTTPQRPLRLDRPHRRFVRVDQSTRRLGRIRNAHDQRTQEEHHFRTWSRLHGRSHRSLQLHPGVLQQGHPQADRQGHEAVGGADKGRTVAVASEAGQFRE